MLSFSFSFSQNPIVTENALAGTPKSTWDISGAGDLTIQGFATDISVNKGQTVRFKIETEPVASYTITIYRIGYYQGNGARLIASLGTFSGTDQPGGSFNSGTGLLDCGNWSESASWAVPATAVSGLYFAKLTKTSGGGSSHITFIVRDDASTSAMLFKTADATWQAYNVYGGNSLYVGGTSYPNGHAAKVSYNRPFITRNGGGGGGAMEDWYMNAEFPMIRFLERNGYDVTYTTDVDMDRDASAITPANHKVILSVGHDEYWSLAERTKFENARAAGVHLAFFSGNEVYWKTRWENSNRTLVCYKDGTLGENVCGSKCDPTSIWTGLWRDGEGYDGGRPENALTGQISWENITTSIQVPAAYKNLRFWRNTSVASLGTGQTATFPNGTLGYEADLEQYPESYPSGRITLSSTAINGNTHKLSLYRHSSGALVFGAGSVQWSWGLDNIHDRGSAAPSVPMQQATVNLFADMGVQPGSIMSGLTLATASTDFTAPACVITSPTHGASLSTGSNVIISGTATDAGGVLVGIEVSVDGGTTWQEASGTSSWTFSWTPTLPGSVNIKVRGFDDSGNMSVPGANGSSNNITVTVGGSNPVCPCNIFSSSATPAIPNDTDGQPIELGVKFRATQSGFITGIRFYKGSSNTGTHIGHLWSSTGTKLAEATFIGETSSGWQQVLFTSPVAISANTTYTASYLSSSGFYSNTNPYFTTAIVNGYLRGLANGEDGFNGVYIYTATGAFPTNNFQTSNYWVDVVYETTVTADITPPTVNLTAPAAGTVSGTINVTANSSDNIGVAGVQFLLDGVNLGAEDVAAPYSVSWNTITATNGNHTLTARARDAAGNTATSTAVIVTVSNDTQLPTVSITAPAAGNVLGTINVTANASDNVGVAGVQFLLDGVNLGAEDVAAPYSVSWNTATATNGNHNLTARVRDAAGNQTTSSVIVVNVNNVPDTELPVTSITAPVAGTVSGTLNVTANATDNIGVVGVQFLLNGANLGTEDIAAPYSVSWNTTTVANGNYTLTARARDAAGNLGTSAPVAVTVFNNYLVAAYGFTENTGTTATDNSGNNNNGTLTNGPTWSASGKFGSAVLFDGTNDFVNIPDASSLDLTNGMTMEAWVNPSNVTGFKTIICKDRTTSNYTYTLAANNNTTTVANQRPSSRARINNTNRTVTGTSKLLLNIWTHVASTYDGATFRLYVNGVQVSSLATTGNITVTTDPLRIGGTTALSGQYFAGLIDEVRIYNRALTQAEIQADMNTPVAPDITNPTVSITAPVAGNVSGTVSVTANAADNISVTGVQFLLDGVNLGAEDIAAPYSVSWNTLTATSGTHTLTARARDAAGNTTTSTAVIVTVNNDTQVPVVNLTEPLAGIVLGTINVSANASDNVGVVGVQFLVDGNILGAEDVIAPYTISWNTTTITEGSHTLTARARDAAGNLATSTPVVVTVQNIPPDIQSPVVDITAPVAGEVSGTLNVTANASDNVAVIGVQFLLNGVNLGTEDVAAPYSVSWNTLTSVNGTYTLTARARDAAGNITISAGEIVTVNNDTQVPVVNLTEPLAGIVLGTINVSANASDNVGVIGVQFLVDGNNLGAEDVTAPYTISWNTTTIAEGNHTLTARARDAAGNLATSTPVVVTVQNIPPDIQSPVVDITAPVAGEVSGTLNVTANASDNVAVIGVQFLLNGANLGIEDGAAPYSVSWNTTTSANGTYTLTAIARDAAGNTTTSAGVIVTVNNDTQVPVVNLTEPLTGIVLGTINVSANASDNVGVIGVQFLVDGNNLGAEDVTAPYTISWNTTTIAEGNHTLTARARDAAGNLATSTPVVVTVQNIPPDIQSPVVDITAPVAGEVSGTLNVTANASDNVAVIGVQFLLNGANLGTEDVAAPYSVSWNTLTSVNGTYTLTARARDAAGNITISAGVIVTVNNDTQVPAVNITAPVAGTVSGTINVTANASDNVGVVGVQFLLNGVNLSTEDLVAPYSISWNTVTSTNGNYTLTARARDAAGNITTSTGVIVTVSNITNLIVALPLNEGTGTAATDISGKSHPGTLTNAPTWGAGKYGQGVNLDGTNDYINIVDHADFTLNPAQSYTWSAWVKNNNFTEWSTVWSQTINTSNFFYFYAHTSTDPDGGPVTNGVSAYWWTSGGTNKIGAHSSNNVLTAGQWSHIAVTYNASQPQNNRFTIYVNGVDVTVRTDVASTGTLATLNATNIRIGSNQAFGEYLSGSVDEVRFYDRLLSSTEVQTDMNTPLGTGIIARVSAPVQLPSQIEKTETSGRIFDVIITPNPSADFFNLVVISDEKEPVTVSVMDISGRVVESYRKVSSKSLLRLGETWTTGTYFAEVIHGSQRKVVKIIKVK